jgi:N-acyl-D-aspartate/D-glutamate deacylase
VRAVLSGLSVFALAACSVATEPAPIEIDTLIIGGTVYDGSAAGGKDIDIGLKQDRIVFIGDAEITTLTPKRVLDASGLIVAPGFIDPHTHTLSDLSESETSQNINYLTQGVTTLLTGNDGGGPVKTAEALENLKANAPGTNVGVFVGHGSVRRAVMGEEARSPSDTELIEMKSLVQAAMNDGAFGLSTGLYYAPGSFADTDEIIELASALRGTGGVYDSHIRDESSYTIGLIKAVDEVIEIGREANVPVHIAHIKALGVDVWDKSDDIISMIETAQAEGIRITADQYPWAASGTRVSNALVPNWAKDGGPDAMVARLQDVALQERLITDMSENLRKRGGAEAILLTSGPEGQIGNTLSDIADDWQVPPIEAARRIVIGGDARIASFNMKFSDIEAFMTRPWVMTSSDGSKGHPRKYASFPKKYETYVKKKQVLSPADFINKSTGLTADTFGLCERGYIKTGFVADIVIFDPQSFKPKANFSNPEVLSEGVIHLFVNGGLAIDDGEPQEERFGDALKLTDCVHSKEVK